MCFSSSNIIQTTKLSSLLFDNKVKLQQCFSALGVKALSLETTHLNVCKYSI